MLKQVSHSAQIVKIEHADGRLWFRRPRAPEPTRKGRRNLQNQMGEDLLTWVSSTDSKAAERVATILDLIVTLGDISRQDAGAKDVTFSWQGRLFTAPVKMGKGFYPEQSPLATELNAELKSRLGRYRFSPSYCMTLGEYPVVGWWSHKDRPRDREEPEEDVWFTEEDAIIRILDLAGEGQLSRLRRCHCGDYFFATFKHQKFCCSRCQQTYFRSSDEYRSKRRLYMKNLRALHKTTYLKSTKAAPNSKPPGAPKDLQKGKNK